MRLNRRLQASWPGTLLARRFLAGVALALGLLASAQAEGDDSLSRKLEQARELSTTAPWIETEALLDEIQPHLSSATPEQRADFRLIRARNQSLSGKMEIALETLESLFGQPLTLNQEARAYALAANVAMLLRRWEETFGYLNRALELSTELDSSEFSDKPFALAAYVYAMIGETDQAINYGKRGVAIAREHGSARDLCLSQGRLAFVYKTAAMFELARGHYREAIERCRESGDELVTGIVESGLADLLRATGDFDQAENLFRQALTRLKETDYHFGLGEARFYKARLHWEKGEHETTETLLEQALPHLLQDQAWDYIAEARQMLADITAGRDNHEQALEHMHRQLEARERFLDRERARQLAYLQVALDTHSREQELALLREQRRVAELESESRRNRDRLRWLVYAFTAFLFLVLALLLVHVLRERRHFRRLAGLDSLTGLSNHTRLFDTARMMVDKAHHDHRPMVFAIGDIDYFKRVNDELGHIAGDRVLIEVARVLVEAFPEPGLIGRIGGEEFAICLPGKTAGQMMPKLDEVRAALSRIDYGGNQSPLSMSFGVAELQPGEPLEILRERADEALYRAKHGGRDTVVIADGSGQ